MTWLRKVDDFMEEIKESHGDQAASIGKSIGQGFLSALSQVEAGAKKTAELATEAVHNITRSKEGEKGD